MPTPNFADYSAWSPTVSSEQQSQIGSSPYSRDSPISNLSERPLKSPAIHNQYGGLDPGASSIDVL
jgi:hypothetical protein